MLADRLAVTPTAPVSPTGRHPARSAGPIRSILIPPGQGHAPLLDQDATRGALVKQAFVGLRAVGVHEVGFRLRCVAWCT